MKQITAVICTHNPRVEYLNRTIESIQRQTLPLEQWQFLIIDNASERFLETDLDLSWHPTARVVRENEAGLTAARVRSIRESQGELIVFIDDDNILDPDYLERAIEIARDYTFLDLFGSGWLEPEFEVKPSKKVTPLLSMLALRTVPSIRWSNHLDDFECIPWGAGMCVRRETAQRFCEIVMQFDTNRVLGRRGGNLFCGEDDLFSLSATTLGKGFGLFPEMKLVHLIPKERLRPEYFLRLLRGHGFSHGILDYCVDKKSPLPIRTKIVLKTFIHGIFNGIFSMRCSWAEALGRSDAATFIHEHALKPFRFSNHGVENHTQGL